MAKEIFHNMQPLSVSEPGRLFVEKIEDLVGVDTYQKINKLNNEYDQVMKDKEAYEQAKAEEDNMTKLELSYRKQVQSLENDLKSLESKLDYYQKKLNSLDENQLDQYDLIIEQYRSTKTTLSQVKQERNEKVNLTKAHTKVETTLNTLEGTLNKFNTTFENTFAQNDIIIQKLAQAADPTIRADIASQCISELSAGMDKNARKVMPEGLTTISTLVRNEASFLKKSLFTSYRLHKHFKENGIEADLPDKIKREHYDWNLLHDNSTLEFENSTMAEIFMDAGAAKYLNAIWEYMENGKGGSIDLGALHKQCNVKIKKNVNPVDWYGAQVQRALDYNQSFYDQTHQQEDEDENEI